MKVIVCVEYNVYVVFKVVLFFICEEFIELVIFIGYCFIWIYGLSSVDIFDWLFEVFGYVL